MQIERRNFRKHDLSYTTSVFWPCRHPDCIPALGRPGVTKQSQARTGGEIAPNSEQRICAVFTVRWIRLGEGGAPWLGVPVSAGRGGRYKL